MATTPSSANTKSFKNDRSMVRPGGSMLSPTTSTASPSQPTTARSMFPPTKNKRKALAGTGPRASTSGAIVRRGPSSSQRGMGK